MKFVLSLISSPETPLLDEELVSVVLAKAGLNGLTKWLAVGEACELEFEAEDGSAVQTLARHAVHDLPVDANVLASDNRRKQILIADMDSTIIHQECIDELGIAAGAGERIMDVTRRAMLGELDFVEALEERVAFMAGLPETAIADVIADRITFVGGGRALVETMKSNGAFCALISGGFTQFTSHVANKCGFHMHQANRLIIEGGMLTGQVAKPALGGAAKIDALNALVIEHGVATADVVSVGDGANDIGMIQLAGLGVAMHAKPAVRAAANTVIDHGDLTALLYLQGYRKSEFA